MVNDLVSDFLAQIRNAQIRKKESITVKSSKMLEAIAELLKSEGFIVDYSVEQSEPQNLLTVVLKYVNGESAIRELVRVSKPGVRTYVGYRDVKPIMKGLGLAVLSTPRGVVSGDTARKEKVGGEYLFYIY